MYVSAPVNACAAATILLRLAFSFDEPRAQTCRYAAPEVLTCAPYGCAVDVYSFGIMLLELSVCACAVHKAAMAADFVALQFKHAGRFSAVQGMSCMTRPRLCGFR